MAAKLVILLLCCLAQVILADFGRYLTIDLTHKQDKNARGWITLPKFQIKTFMKEYTVEWGHPEQW